MVAGKVALVLASYLQFLMLQGTDRAVLELSQLAPGLALHMVLIQALALFLHCLL